METPSDSEPLESRLGSPLESRHLGAGLWGLAVFVVLGLVLESLHAFKAPFYLDAGQETARLLLRLAHAHGTLVCLINVVYALVLRARPEAASVVGSTCMLASAFLLPLGFLLGGLFAHGGDPGLGVILVPPGALALAAGIVITARRV